MSKEKKSSPKKLYERPELAKLDFFEAGSAGCCKTSNATCSTAARASHPGKTRSSSTS